MVPGSSSFVNLACFSCPVGTVGKLKKYIEFGDKHPILGCSGTKCVQNVANGEEGREGRRGTTLQVNRDQC